MKHVEFYRNNIDGKGLVLTGGQAPESVGGTLPADDFYYGVQ